MARPGIALCTFLLVALIGIAGVIGVLGGVLAGGEPGQSRVVEAVPMDTPEVAFPEDSQPVPEAVRPLEDILEFPRVAVLDTVPWTLVLLPDGERPGESILMRGTLARPDDLEADAVTMVMRYAREMGAWAGPAVPASFAVSRVDYRFEGSGETYDVAIDLAAIEDRFVDTASLAGPHPELLWNAPLPPVAASPALLASIVGSHPVLLWNAPLPRVDAPPSVRPCRTRRTQPTVRRLSL